MNIRHPYRRRAAFFVLSLLLTLSGACESPTDPNDPGLGVDDFVDSTVSPDPIRADVSDGKTYRIVRGNNQPDEIVPYDWKARFSVETSLNENATDEDVEVAFPVKLTASTVKVQQAAGGIINPPTGGEIERFESIIVSSTGNQLAAVGSPLTVTFDVWYDLPSLQREALFTTTLSFVDDDGYTFTKLVETQVAP